MKETSPYKWTPRLFQCLNDFMPLDLCLTSSLESPQVWPVVLISALAPKLPSVRQWSHDVRCPLTHAYDARGTLAFIVIVSVMRIKRRLSVQLADSRANYGCHYPSFYRDIEEGSVADRLSLADPTV